MNDYPTSHYGWVDSPVRRRLLQEAPSRVNDVPTLAEEIQTFRGITQQAIGKNMRFHNALTLYQLGVLTFEEAIDVIGGHHGN